MSINIPNRYKKLIDVLEPFIDEHGIDKVTVSSLIQGCVQFSDTEEENASVIFVNTDGFEGSKSIKFTNIKVGLRYALDVIFTAKMIPQMDDIWLILAVLKTIVCLLSGMTVTIEKEEATVLFAVYRLNRAEKKEINKYLISQRENLKDIDVENIDIEKSIVNLEKIGCILLDNGKYRLNENVVIS